MKAKCHAFGTWCRLAAGRLLAIHSPWKRGTRVYVVSRELSAESAPGVTVVREDPVAVAASLRHEAGSGEIWLFGGGRLFATLLAGRQVGVIPSLGTGVARLLAPCAPT